MDSPFSKQSVFLSYAWKDAEKVEKVYEILKQPTNDILPRMFKWDSLPRKDWEDMISKALDDTKIVLLFFSENAVTRTGALHPEIQLTLDAARKFPKGDITLIPLKLDDTEFPPQLKWLPYAHVFEEGGLEQVIRVIKNDLIKETKTDAENLFIQKDWIWLIEYNGNTTFCDHTKRAGFKYLHFIIASGEEYLSINALKKVKTSIHQPSAEKLLGLPKEEEEKEEENVEDKLNNGDEAAEEPPSEKLLFQQIRDEIIIAIQSIQDDELREYFRKSIKFIGDFYVKFKDKNEGVKKKVEWRVFE